MRVDSVHPKPVESAEAGARAFTETPFFEGLARAGYIARGVIYALIGLLAIQLANGVSGPRPNQQGAMQQIAHQRYGHLLLVLTAIRAAQRTRSDRRGGQLPGLRHILRSRHHRPPRDGWKLLRPAAEDHGRCAVPPLSCRFAGKSKRPKLGSRDCSQCRQKPPDPCAQVGAFS